VDGQRGGRLIRLGDVKTGTLEQCDVLFFCGNPVSLSRGPSDGEPACHPMWVMRHPDESIGVYRTAHNYAAPTKATVEACKRGAQVPEGKLLRRLRFSASGWWSGPRLVSTWSQRVGSVLTLLQSRPSQRSQRPSPDIPLPLHFRLHTSSHRLIVRVGEDDRGKEGQHCTGSGSSSLDVDPRESDGGGRTRPMRALLRVLSSLSSSLSGRKCDEADIPLLDIHARKYLFKGLLVGAAAAGTGTNVGMH
jgi:hypothetical protein